MSALAPAALVALLTGLLSYQVTREFTLFNALNLAGGGLGLAWAGARGLHGLAQRSRGAPHSGLARGAARVLFCLIAAAGIERLAARTLPPADLSFERAFELSPALKDALAEMPAPLEALLFYDAADRRVRRSRLLLEALAQAGPVEVRLVDLARDPELAQQFELDASAASSNQIVLVLGEHWEPVERASEASLYESLYRLLRREEATLVVLRGEGEGSLESVEEDGYSGFVTALLTEGYRVEGRVSASLAEIPPGTDAVVALAPQRRLLPHSLDALRRYLAEGGRLVALLEPGRESGLEEVLAEWGITAPPGLLVVDPASAPLDRNRGRGVDVLAYGYESQHRVTRGLDADRVTLFPGVRPLDLRKPASGDRLTRMVLSSPRSFVSDDLGWLSRSGAPEPGAQAPERRTLVASGRYERGGRETRIVAFGDADCASNRYLRSLYNLDLLLNSVHWATERTQAITLRPKALRGTLQFPVPLQNSLTAFYGIGLLLPELLLIAGLWVGLRRRQS